MKGRSLVKIALSLVFTFILTLVMVAVPSDIASAANINDKLFNFSKIERTQNLTNKGVSETPKEESRKAERNENGSPELGGESSENEDSEPEACPPRNGCPRNEFKKSTAAPISECRKCPALP